MSSGEHDDTLERFERRLTELATAHYVLLLFVSGASELSALAVGNVRLLCENHLPGRYHLDVVDIHRNPQLMVEYGVVAAPTLVRQEPTPRRMLVGDLSNTARVLGALDIRVPAATTSPSG